MVGIGAGHVYWFLEDVFPNQPNGRKLLKTPQFLRNIFDEPPDDDYIVLPEGMSLTFQNNFSFTFLQFTLDDRPGGVGFEWGNAGNNNNANNNQQNQ